ncbi:MAG: hypothetical protein IPH80_29815 [Myxococcales bacterium]|nr:hypothetical protein [Myxococcales bacterium]
MSDAGPSGGADPDVADAPFRGSVDPLGARLERFELPGPRPRLPMRGPYAVGALGLGAVSAVTGHVLPALAWANMGIVGLLGWNEHRRARPRTMTVDAHERGLRLGVDLAWAAIATVTIDTTPDQGDAPTTLTIVTPDATAAVVSTAVAVGPLLAVIAAAVGPRHHREAAARLAEGQAYTFGRHAFTQDGLRIKATLVPWRDVGPIRGRRGKLVCGSPLGRVAAPIAGAPNPWMLERLVAERGRAA